MTRAERVSGFLGAIGLQPGDRVATMLPSTTDYVAAWHGIMWRNGIDVPINNEYKGAFLEHILRDSGARAIVADARWVERLARIGLGDLEHLVVVGELDTDVPPGLTVHRFDDALTAVAGVARAA